MNIAFMGSPRFASVVLENLLKSKHKVVCVVTQPDAEAGRGQKLQYNAVKLVSLKNNIPVIQPSKISLDTSELISYRPDIIVTCAFGQMLKQNILDLAPYGVINVHGSLLPKYRGAAPIQWAVINGENKTGITIAKTELGLDCGPIIYSVETEILPHETSGDLFDRLPVVASNALIKALNQIENGSAKYVKQDENLVTYAPMLNKEMGRIDWSKSATDISNLVRGLNPWPSAFFNLDNEIIKLHKVTAINGNAKPGEVVYASSKEGFVIGCGEGLLCIDILQPAGKKFMTAKDFCNGRKLNYITLS